MILYNGWMILCADDSIRKGDRAELRSIFKSHLDEPSNPLSPTLIGRRVCSLNDDYVFYRKIGQDTSRRIPMDRNYSQPLPLP